jgi:methionyl-tRNA formyltransferase
VRIIVNGQQAFGAEVLKALLERGEDVVAVYCAPDRPGRGADPLKQAAVDAGIPVEQPESFKDEETASRIRSWEPDLMVMAFVTLIVPESVLSIPRHGTIQYHPSLLPLHRGPSAINWAVIHGDDMTGVTIFWPDEGLDTGPVLLRREVAITDEDTMGSLYFDKLFPIGVEAMAESVDLVRAGDAPKEEQDESQATYEGWCGRDDVEIDWSAPARRVYDRIRGANPRPGAWTTVGGSQVELLDCRLLEGDTGAAPGQVLEVTDDAVAIAAGGGALSVSVLRLDSGDKVGPAEVPGLAAGARLGGS